MGLSQVSLARITSGSLHSSIAQKLSLFERILWKFITYIGAFFLERGTFLCDFGDDVYSGDPILLSVFTEEKEVWLWVLQVELLASKSSNKLVLKFGRPQPQQYQLISVCSNGSYRTVGIFRQFLWNHQSQFEQATERTFIHQTHAFSQMPQGYLTILGPGLGWQSDALNINSEICTARSYSA